MVDKDNKSFNLIIIFVVVLILIGGYYYYFVYKKGGETSAVYTPKVISPVKDNLTFKTFEANYSNKAGAPDLGPAQQFTSIDEARTEFRKIGATAIIHTGDLYYPRTAGAPRETDTILVYHNDEYYSVSKTGVDWDSYEPVTRTDITYGNLLITIKDPASGVNAACIPGDFDVKSPLSTVIPSLQLNTKDRLINLRDPGDGYSTDLLGGDTFPFTYTFTSFQTPPLL